MRPAIEAGLRVLLEAADPYVRPVLSVSKATFSLSKFTCRKFGAYHPRSGKVSAGQHMRRRLIALIALIAHFFFANHPLRLLLRETAVRCVGNRCDIDR